MRILAFDAATQTGWAFKDVEEGWWFGTIDPYNWQELQWVFFRTTNRHPFKRATHVVIEDCYLGANVATLKKLAQIQGILVLASIQHGLSWEVVPPAVWHGDLRLTGKRQERKLGSQRIARDILKVPVTNADEADAVCICDYAMRKKGVEYD